MKKVILSVVFALGCITFVNAQNPADLASSAAVQETQNVQSEIMEFPEDALINSLNSSLSKQGKSLGVINSRNIAYSIAEMTAKMNLLRMAGEQITSGRGFQLLEDIVEGEDPDAQQKATMLQKAAKVADKSLDKALSELGVSDDEIRKMNTAKKKAVYEQNFNQTVRTLVAGMVQGCAVVRIAEGESGGDDYQVAVCIKYSPEFQSLASLIKEGGNGSIPMGAAKSSRNKIMSMSPNDLVMKMGVWVTYNERGEMVIYGFGQQEVREVGSRQSAAFSRAYSQARLQAINNVKNFVAEDIVANEVMQNVEKLAEYADGTNAYFSRTKWQQAVKAKETTLNIATEQVRQWKGVHPTSNTNVAGYVVAWTYSNAQQANKLKQQLNRSGSIRNGVKNTTVRKPTTKGKITITGNDEDL